MSFLRKNTTITTTITTTTTTTTSTSITTCSSACSSTCSSTCNRTSICIRGNANCSISSHSVAPCTAFLQRLPSKNLRASRVRGDSKTHSPACVTVLRQAPSLQATNRSSLLAEEPLTPSAVATPAGCFASMTTYPRCLSTGAGYVGVSQRVLSTLLLLMLLVLTPEVVCTGTRSAQLLPPGRELKLEANDEKRLLDFLMVGYDRDVRPVKNASHPIVIQLGITLTQIFDMDEKNQVLTTNVWLDQEWMDELLHWDPADYNGLETIRLPCERIWLPDIVLYNNADDYTRGYMNSKAMVSYQGKVFWPPPTKFRSTCPVDVTYFPFDDQTCILKLGSWIYDGFQVDVTNRTAEVDLTNYIPNGEWELLEARIIRNVIYYSCCPEPFPDVTITITIRRKTLYYMYNVVLPCMMMSVLTLLVFCLPPDSGEKIALGVTVLLAFSVFMLAIAEKMPETSESIPLIGIYLTAVMTITSISIIMTVIVLNCHYRGPIQREVPPWMRRAFLEKGVSGPNTTGLCGRLHRRRRNQANQTSEENPHPHPHPRAHVVTTALYGDYSNSIAKEHITKAETIRLTVDGVHDDLKETAPVEYSSAEDLHTYGWREYNDTNSYKRSNANSHYSPNLAAMGPSRAHEEIVRALKLLLGRQEQEDADKKRLNEWRTIAIAVDRILFWIFFLVTTVSSVVFLVVLPVVKRSEYVRNT